MPAERTNSFLPAYFITTQRLHCLYTKMGRWQCLPGWNRRIYLRKLFCRFRFNPVFYLIRQGREEIDIRSFLYAVYCYHIFLQWLMSGAVGENKSYGLRIFLIINQYDFIESMGDCHFVVADSFGAFSIIYGAAGNVHCSIFFCPLA